MPTPTSPTTKVSIEGKRLESPPMISDPPLGSTIEALGGIVPPSSTKIHGWWVTPPEKSSDQSARRVDVVAKIARRHETAMERFISGAPRGLTTAEGGIPP